jgi:nucleotide-binding universal stress UspA family protein
MKKIKPIIVGIDFSDSSAIVLRKAIHASGLRETSVVAVHVLNSSHLHHWAGHKNEDCSRGTLIEQSKVRLSGFVQQEAAGGEVEQEVCIGRPVDELVRIVREREASMLVIAANDMSKGHLGTTASRCLRGVPTDVLVVRNWQSGNFKKIVVCTDCSPASERVVEKSIGMAALNGAALEILHVIYPPERDLWGENIEESNDDSTRYPERVRRRAQKSLENTLAPFASQLVGIDSSTVILESVVPSVALGFHIEDSGADLAVLGTRYHSKIASIFVGTNAERLMHDATVSVLAVRF